MSTFSLDPIEINTDDLKDSKNIKAISDYLYMLNEQLRYVLSNLSSDDNFDQNTSGFFTQIAKEIHLYAKKGELSAELSLEDGVVSLIGNRVIIDSDYFKVDQLGRLKATDGEFSGTITGSGISSFLAGVGYASIIGGIIQTTGGPSNATSKLYDGRLEVRYSDTNWSSLQYGMLSINQGAAATFLTATSGSINYSPIMTAANVNSGYVIHPEANTSDERIKKDIIEAPDKWINVLKSVEVKEFTYKRNTVWQDKGNRQLGVIAQQVQEVLDENDGNTIDLVFRREVPDEMKLDTKKYTNGEDPWTVDYAQFIPMLIMGYQKQQEKIEELERRIKELEGGNE